MPLITVGVTIAGLLFVVIALCLPIQLPEFGRWLVLVLMILWLLAMIAIRGSIVATLRRLAPVSELPIANQVLIVVLGLVGAAGPLLGMVLGSVPVSAVFMVGAIALMVGSTVFYSSMIQLIQPSALKSADVQSLPEFEGSLFLMAGVGLGAGCILNLMLRLIPPTVQGNLPSVSPAMLVSSVLIIAALATSPVGKLAQKLGHARGLQIGLLTGVILLLGSSLPFNSLIPSIVLLVGAGITIGMVLISMVPFALGSVKPSQAGLSAGLFFGGSGLSSALLIVLTSRVEPIESWIGLGIGVIALAIAVLSSVGITRMNAMSTHELIPTNETKWIES